MPVHTTNSSGCFSEIKKSRRDDSVYYYCIKISHQNDYIKRGFFPWLAETSAQSDNNSKKATDNRKKYKRNNEDRISVDKVSHFKSLMRLRDFFIKSHEIYETFETLKT